MWITIEIPDDVIPKRQDFIEVYISFIDGQPCECDYPFVVIESIEESEACISRQAVIDTIDNCNSDGLTGIFCSYADGERFKKYIRELPIVQPKSMIESEV